MSSKAKRQRAPLLCLNCKKRKVRCDKNRPCGGCVKNNVPHLCVYVEPQWASNLRQFAAPTPTELPEYQALKARLEAQIAAQHKELEALRGTRTCPAPAPPAAPFAPCPAASPALSPAPVTILAKLSSDPQLLEVVDNQTYSLRGFRARPANPPPGGLYAWLNTIKLDPQLTALWFRITSLQKLYHIYKTNLLSKLKQEPEQTPSDLDGDLRTCGHRQCPVVACEFNLMVEEANRPPTPQAPPQESPSAAVQRLWREMGSCGREPLSGAQLEYLVAHYCDPANELELLSILAFFQREMAAAKPLFEPRPGLDLEGVYVAMLALAVEELLEVLRAKQTPSFLKVFPSETLAVSRTKRTRVLELVRQYIELMAGTPAMADSLAWVLLLVAFLNRCVAAYDAALLVARDAFLAVFAVLVLLVDGPEPLELWVDPAHVHFRAFGVAHNRNASLRRHLGAVWSDVLRLVCLVGLQLVPVCKHSHTLDVCVDRLFRRIADAGHAEGSSTQPEMHVYTLVARTLGALLRGTQRGAQVSVGDLQLLARDMARWGGDLVLAKLRTGRYFEVRAMLHYLEFYVAYLVFLQCEEDGDGDASAHLPHLANKCLDLNKFLQRSVVQFAHGPQCLLVAAAECLLRVLHFIVGLLIRFRPHAEGALAYDNAKLPLVIPLSDKEEVISEADRTIKLLEQLLPREVHLRVCKVWRFYMTFVRHSHRMSPAAYASIHADVFAGGKLECPVLPEKMDKMCPALVPLPMRSNELYERKRKCPFEAKPEPEPEKPSVMYGVLPLARTESLDWDTLPNFDFDIVGDDIMSGAADIVGIEELFQ